MSFFDQKEDVLEIEMTPYGKDLYAKGLFAPAYYSFHDDEIIYDISYADNRTENQTASFERIVEEGVYLRPQARYSSVQNTVKNLEIINILTDNDPNGLPLGNSSLNSDYKPAWSINFLSGTIKTFSEQYINSVSASKEIPQIGLADVDTVYEIIPAISSTPEETDDGLSLTFKDGATIKLEDNYLLISAEELNVDILKENFDIELFIAQQEGENSESLKRVYFKKQKEYIKNNILLDENQVSEEIVDQNLEFADIYFDIEIDREIDFGRGPEAGSGTFISRELTRSPFGGDC